MSTHFHRYVQRLLAAENIAFLRSCMSPPFPSDRSHSACFLTFSVHQQSNVNDTKVALAAPSLQQSKTLANKCREISRYPCRSHADRAAKLSVFQDIQRLSDNLWVHRATRKLSAMDRQARQFPTSFDDLDVILKCQANLLAACREGFCWISLVQLDL